MFRNMQYNPEYTKAFQEYLRYGKEITVPYHIPRRRHVEVPEVYVWRTRKDEKVRYTHAANDGKIFYSSRPPATGHPGEDYNCRCIAEAYIEGATEYANQTLISMVNEAPRKWDDVGFALHSYLHRGVAVTLSETGNLQGVINYYFYKLDVMDRINAQIIETARKYPTGGGFSYDFNNSYGFGEYIPCFGGGTVSGLFIGNSVIHGPMMSILGAVSYKYYDVFTDILHLRDKLFIGTSDPEAVSELTRLLTDIGSAPYVIQDSWETRFAAKAKLNRPDSQYQWDFD